MLLSIQKRDVSSYQTFRQALIENNQGHVVDRFLPLIQTTQPDPESQKTQLENKGNASVSKFELKLQKIGSFGLKVIESHLNPRYTYIPYIQNTDICKDY